MDLALFPLNAVLFPGGMLGLRVFEPRYMDMVRDCMRHQRPFGVCMIARGSEVGDPAQPEAVGCIATIEAWDMRQLGLLHIRALGQERFRIRRSHAGADRLLRGEVEAIAPDPDSPIAPEHQACADLLGRIIDDHERQQKAKPAAGTGDEPPAMDVVRFAQPHQMQSSVWVGNRLCEVLSIPLRAKQKLMELEDAYMRLEIVQNFLKQHSVIG
ncbi:MAG TPA: LON peptidase substrate-binding domain-containing protein [Burkholderiaceae bacterium]